MSVRLKIALTIFLAGLLTAVGVLAIVSFGFQRFEHESMYYRASDFLDRVTAKHTDIFTMQERFQDEFNSFLSNLVLFEPDTQVYLLDREGTVIASSNDTVLPKGFKVAMGPVLQAAGPEPMPYVMGDDPQRMDAATIVSARPLHRAVIRNNSEVDGYLYVVCRKTRFPRDGLMALQSTFAKPTLLLILAVVALSTLLATWVTAAVTRPLKRLTDAVAAVTKDGMQGVAAAPDTAIDKAFQREQSAGNDEFAQLSNGIGRMLHTLHSQWSMLRRLDHFRREGVSNLSHDLRSPLTATAACLETLQTRWLGLEARNADRQLVEVALRNTQNAARLVRSLGDLAQLDEPEFQPNTQVMDITELLDDVALRFTERAARLGVHIQASAGESDLCVALDVELIERALANLVDNALKVCPVGSRITLGATQSGDEVLITVSDTGPGIPPADLPHLFDRFYQARNNVAPATGEGGKGLGLAIVKRIVEIHGGRVQIESTPGVGTQVTLVLRLATAHNPQHSGVDIRP
jgi:signal transduction histidine kinase